MNTDLEYAIKSAVSDIIGAAPDGSIIELIPARSGLNLTSNGMAFDHGDRGVPVRIVDRRGAVVAVAAAVAAIGVAGLVGIASRSGPAPAPADSPPPPAATVIEPVQEVEGDTAGKSAARLSPEDLFVAAVLAPDRTELDRFNRAVTEHRSTCMAEAGFNEAPELAPLAQPADAYVTRGDFLYDNGYDLPGVFEGSPPEQWQPVITAEMSAALDRCNQPVIALMQEAYSANDLGNVDPGAIDGQIIDNVFARPDIADKTLDWKNCMTDAGYPTEVDPTPGNTSIEQAEAGISCRTSTGYTTVLVAAQAEEVASWLASNQDTVEAFKQLYADLADAAERLS